MRMWLVVTDSGIEVAVGRLRTWMIPSFETLRWLIHEATAGEKPSRIYHLPPLNSIVLEGADREVPHSSEDIRDKGTE
jgi:hypothetical protein